MMTPASESDDAPAIVLCDWAEAINGKLYMQGAGINILRANAVFPLALAVLWNVPWHLTNTRHRLVMRLVTSDGEPFLDASGAAVQIVGEVEVGRPPGSKHGDSFPSPVAINLPPIQIPPGDYRWELVINDQPRARASFRALDVGGPQ